MYDETFDDLFVDWRDVEREVMGKDTILYGSLDGLYPQTELIRELTKEEGQASSEESIWQRPFDEVIKVKRVFMYKRELTEEELEGYNMVLLGEYTLAKDV